MIPSHHDVPDSVATLNVAAPVLLLVDDEPLIRDMLANVFKLRGWQVIPASDGEEAVRLYREHPHRVDLVLLDVQMPGMDGPTTLARLREINPHMRCCLMSGNLGTYHSTDFKKWGIDELLLKPFPVFETAERLRERLPSRPAPAVGPG